MATHGAARQETIAALSGRKPFRRSGFAMTAHVGPAGSTGRLEGAELEAYKRDRSVGIAYTVLSYSTPIAWVTVDGDKRVPATTYSRTTTHHQHLCRTYL